MTEHHRMPRSSAGNKRARRALSAACLGMFLFATGAASAEQYTWKPLRVGGGGWITDLDVAPDGTMVVKTDTYGAYKWNPSTSQWDQLVTMSRMPAGHRGVDYLTKGVEGAHDIEIADSDSSIMYMALPTQSQIYKTTNGGSNWTAVGPSYPANTFIANGVSYRFYGEKIAIDPQNPDVVYVGTYNQGLLHTDDGGASWSTVGDVPSSGAISGVCFDDTSAVVGGKQQIAYAFVAGSGTYRTANGGTSWSRISDGIGDPGGPGSNGFHATCANGDYWLAAGAAWGGGSSSEALWKYDGSWTEYSAGARRIVSVTVNPNDPDHVVAAIDGGHLVISTDGGSSWGPITWVHTRTATDIPWHAYTEESFMSNGNMAFDPITPNKLWFAMGIGVFHTTLSTPHTDSPSSTAWIEQTKGIEQLVGNRVIAAPGSSTAHLCGWDRGLFSTSDFDAFPAKHAYGTGMSHCYGAGYAVNDPDYIVQINQRFGTEKHSYSDDNGATWSRLPSDPKPIPNGGTMAISTPQNFVFVAAQNGPAWYTTNGASSWSEVSLPGASNGGYINLMWANRHIVAADGATLNTFYLFKCGTAFCTAGGEGLYRSTNGGVSWTKVHTGRIATGTSAVEGNDAYLKSVPGEAGHLFYSAGQIGALGQSNPADSNLMRSVDGGATWTEVPGAKEVYAMGFGDVKQPADYPRVWIAGFVGGTFGVYYSDDCDPGGACGWTQVGDGFPMGIFDNIMDVEGMKDGSDRVMVAFRGTGYAYGAPSGSAPLAPPLAPILLP